MSKKQKPLFTPRFPPGSRGLDSILHSNRRLNIWEGSVRSGKTIASIIRWLKFVAYEAPNEGALVMTGKTGKTLERNIINPIKDMLGEDKVNYRRGLGTIEMFGREIDVVSALDERSQEKIRGATIAGAYGDELTLWPESFFKMLLSRLSVEGAMFFGTTNPDSPYHWLKTDYLDRAAELNDVGGGITTFHFKLDDNPFLPKSYVQSIKQEYTGLWYNRFIEGLWVLADGAVYDMWNEDLHVVDVRAMLEADVREGRRKEPRFKHYIVGVDYGTANPCTFGLYGYDQLTRKSNGLAQLPTIYLEREYYWDSSKANRQKTDSQYGEDFKDFLGDIRPDAIYVDPSAASFISELRHRGYRVTEAKNDVLDGIRFIGNLLTSGRFLVDKSCQDTIREFGCYLWDSKAQQRGLDAPIKENDHAHDRNRYAIYTHFFREHPTIVTGFNYR